MVLEVPVRIEWDDIEEDLAKGNIVKVVRCKDCKYYLKSNEECQLINTRLHFYETGNKWAEDSFCAWAERKDT